MFWKRIYRRKLRQRDNSTQKPGISRGRGESQPLGVDGCGDATLMGEQEMDCHPVDSDEHRDRKEREMGRSDDESDNITYSSAQKPRISRESGKSKPLGGDGFGDATLMGNQDMDYQGVGSDERIVSKKPKMGRSGQEYENTTNVDRISDLPEPLIHRIFSFLRCQKDLVRLRILSKQWNNIFKSYSTFVIDERYFQAQIGGKGKQDLIEAREMQKNKFKIYVENALASSLDLVPSVDKFKLCVTHMHDDLEVCMKRWMSQVVDKNVKELDIRVSTNGIPYVFPSDVLVSKSISSLKLSGVLLNMSTTLELCNLRELSIKDVYVTDMLIKKFELCCPLIEDFRLIGCRGLRRFSVSALVKLRRVEVHECALLKYIEIEAPDLETFWYHAKKNQSCKLDLKGCRELKNLTLKDYRMTDTEFQDFISKYPLIQRLMVQECGRLERPTILSGRLKCVVVIQCRKLQEINIDAPNLYSFQYCGPVVPFPSMNVSSLREAKFSSNHPIVPFAFVGCQNVFGNLNWTKDLKLILHTEQVMKIYEDPKDPNLLKNNFSKLHLTRSSTRVLKIIDDWLRVRRGRSLTLISLSSEMVELVHRMIVDRKDPICCEFYSKKCWRHYLVDVKMTELKTDCREYCRFQWTQP